MQWMTKLALVGTMSLSRVMAAYAQDVEVPPVPPPAEETTPAPRPTPPAPAQTPPAPAQTPPAPAPKPPGPKAPAPGSALPPAELRQRTIAEEKNGNADQSEPTCNQRH